MLKEIATAIWNQLGNNERANSATTIAVVECQDGKLYCTSNDVTQISAAAVEEAKKFNISPDAYGNYISQSGAGFHAEMWAVILAMQAIKQDIPEIVEKDARLAYVLGKVSTILKNVGASRPCCKNCTDVLKILKVAMEETSGALYRSWYNPMTVDEYCEARKWFHLNQYWDIPDFRNHKKDYWFNYSKNNKYQNYPPNSAN
jgi:hypothetical protein